MRCACVHTCVSVSLKGKRGQGGSRGRNRCVGGGQLTPPIVPSHFTLITTCLHHHRIGSGTCWASRTTTTASAVRAAWRLACVCGKGAGERKMHGRSLPLLHPHHHTSHTTHNALFALPGKSVPSALLAHLGGDSFPMLHTLRIRCRRVRKSAVVLCIYGRACVVRAGWGGQRVLPFPQTSPPFSLFQPFPPPTHHLTHTITKHTQPHTHKKTGVRADP